MQTEAQKKYWNSISSEYRAVTRIDSSDFHYGPRLAGESELRLLPELTVGMSALELGCGAAQNSIWLAKRGVVCTAVDISEKQLEYAKIDAKKADAGIDFVCSPLESLEFDEKFDLIHSSHAFEFIDNPGKLIRKCVEWLKPGGHLVISTVHPVYNGEWIFAEDEDDPMKSSWGRFLPNYFSPVDDVREQPDGAGEDIASRAWPIGKWFDWIAEAGLRLIVLKEPPAVKNPAYSSEAWEDDDGEAEAIPTTLILIAKKEE